MFCERSVDKREKRNERTGNVLSDICTSTIFLFPSLIDVSEGLLAFFFCSRFLIRTVNCTLSLQSDPPPPHQAICTHVTLHFGSHMFITAIRVNSGGLVWQSVHEVPQDTGRTQQPTPARPIPLKSSGVPCAIGRASGEPKHCG